MPETIWKSKLHWNNPSQRLTTKWYTNKRSLHGSTIAGNRRQYYKTKLGLNHLNNKELKELSKKQMRDMLQLAMKDKLIVEKNDSIQESNRPNRFSNPILHRSNSPPVKTRLIMSRKKKPMPWTVQRRALLSKKNYNKQTGNFRSKK